MPHKYMFNICKLFLNQPHLFLPGEYLRWLGLDHNLLTRVLNTKGFRTQNFTPLIGDSDSCRIRKSFPEDAALQHIARYPVSIEAEASLHDLANSSEKYNQLFEKWLEILRWHLIRITNLFDKFAPKSLVLVQGYEPINAVARLIAISRNIPMIAIENTALFDRMLWDNISGITTNKSLAKNYFWRFGDSVQDELVTQYIGRLIRDTKSKKQGEHMSPNKIYVTNGYKKRRVLFLAQVYTDSSVLFGSGTWRDQVEIIVALANLARDFSFQLIIKLHPKEISGSAPVTYVKYNKLTYRKIRSSKEFQNEILLGADVVIDHDNEFDTYALIAATDVAVTTNSQAGLEAAIRGVPTIVCGDAYYGSMGFTLEAPDSEILKSQLYKSLHFNETDKLRLAQAAKIFTYIYFEKYCVNKTEESLADLVISKMYT